VNIQNPNKKQQHLVREGGSIYTQRQIHICSAFAHLLRWVFRARSDLISLVTHNPGGNLLQIPHRVNCGLVSQLEFLCIWCWWN